MKNHEHLWEENDSFDECEDPFWDDDVRYYPEAIWDFCDFCVFDEEQDIYSI